MAFTVQMTTASSPNQPAIFPIHSLAASILAARRSRAFIGISFLGRDRGLVSRNPPENAIDVRQPADQFTQPAYAVTRTAAPKAIRYQANGVKSCVAI